MLHPLVEGHWQAPTGAVFCVRPVVSFAGLEDLREGRGDVPGCVLPHHPPSVGQAGGVHFWSLLHLRSLEAFPDGSFSPVHAAGVEGLRLLVFVLLLLLGLVRLLFQQSLFHFLSFPLLVPMLMHKFLPVVGDEFLL